MSGPGVREEVQRPAVPGHSPDRARRIFRDVLTFSGAAYTTSGRITALAVDPSAATRRCRVWAGAAGGGVWRTDNALVGEWRQTGHSCRAALQPMRSERLPMIPRRGLSTRAPVSRTHREIPRLASGIYKSTNRWRTRGCNLLPTQAVPSRRFHLRHGSGGIYGPGNAFQRPLD